MRKLTNRTLLVLGSAEEIAAWRRRWWIQRGAVVEVPAADQAAAVKAIHPMLVLLPGWQEEPDAEARVRAARARFRHMATLASENRGVLWLYRSPRRGALAQRLLGVVRSYG